MQNQNHNALTIIAMQLAVGAQMQQNFMTESKHHADDILLINRTEEDMKKNVKILMEDVNKKKLKINFSKSAVMSHIGKNNNIDGERSWRITDANGNDENVLRSVNEYKYLGLILGKSTGYVNHRNSILRKSRRKVGVMKLLAN